MHDICGLVANLIAFMFAASVLLRITMVDEMPMDKVDRFNLFDWMVWLIQQFNFFSLQQDDLMV